MKVALITVRVAVVVVIITEVELVKGRRSYNVNGARGRGSSLLGTPGKYAVTENRRPASAAQKPKGPRYVVGKPGSRFTGVRQKSPKAPAKNRKPAPSNRRTKNTTHKATAKQTPSKQTGNATTDHPPAAGTHQDGTGDAGPVMTNHGGMTGGMNPMVGHGGMMDPMAMGMGGMGMGGMGMGGMGMGGMGMGGMGMGMMGGKAGMYGMMANQITKSVGGAAVGVAREAAAARQNGNLDPGLEDTPGGEGKDDKEGGNEDKDSKKKDSKEENKETTDKKSEKSEKEEEGNKEERRGRRGRK
nr:peroxidase-like protein 2 isoform X2 [Dermacentor andersoni]